MQPPPILSDVERARLTARPQDAWTLPPFAYTDPAVWAWEREVVFGTEWVCVGRAEHVANAGDHLAVDVVDQPVLVTRSADGQLRAMSNVCLHRSMPLASGSGSSRWIVCPYHQWSYGLDGSLHTAPMMADDFDVAACRLPQFAVEVWEGFVFVSTSPTPVPLTPRLARLTDRLANYRLADLVIADTLEFDSPWNWKLLVENFMEAYHHIGPHRDTFQQNHPAAAAFVADNHGEPFALLEMPGTDSVDVSDGLPFLSGLERHQRSDMLAFCVFPSTLVATTGTLVTWYQLEPTAHDRMRLRIHVLLEPEVAGDPEVVAALPLLADGIRWIHEEDIPVNEGPWRGLHAPTAGQGRLAPGEHALWQFNQFWLAHVDAAATRVSPPAARPGTTAGG
jgi:phenylpropionate dioxygenase-like ring-hydroxylating dioxygenase large terminal subunit